MILRFIRSRKHLEDMDYYKWSMSKRSKINVKLLYFLGFSVFFYLWIYLAVSDPYYMDNPFYLFLFVGIGLVEILILVPIVKFLKKKRYKRMLVKKYKDTSDKELTISLTENRLILQNSEAQSKIAYSIIEEVIETNEYVFIFVEMSSGIPIPLESFKDSDEKEAFLNYLNNKIASNLP